jgi:uncharacterized protein
VTDPAARAFDVAAQVARDLGLEPRAVRATLELLDGGATVPFVARYRKEATGGLDESALRAVEERAAYAGELEQRRRSVLAEIERQGKLTPELRASIEACTDKARLEDLYVPFRPKRRTRATVARERGLEPLADRIWAQGDGEPRREAAAFVDGAKGVADVEAALAGARDICAERIAERAEVRALVRDAFARTGLVRVRKTREHAKAATKFDAYASYEEPASRMPSHRVLAIRRGEAQGVLRVAVEIDLAAAGDALVRLARVRRGSAWGAQLELAARDALERLVAPSVEGEVRADRNAAADRDAVEVFARNLRQLLLAAPLGPKTVVGVDPGQRTGCKLAVVDATGRPVEHSVLFLVQGEAGIARARADLRAVCARHRPAAIAVGNGTHGRETEAFVRDALSSGGRSDILVVSVSEAGASVYSASELARDELPDLDVTVRGAVSIARRLQDPLAELVKIDPQSIGVGQYQHDVQQPLLARKLDEVVESCVNAVGVELSTASAALLAHVAGLGPATARRIVEHRQRNGPFASRRHLRKVPGIGPKTFEQAAGFLRLRDGEHPLDASAVHPERYELVERMARDAGVGLASLVGDASAVDRIDWQRYVSSEVGEPTLRDILEELRKPGRDPRASFEPPAFRDDVRMLEDLRDGMQLEGVVTNVTAFGAFVDVGVHQDGLVHVSQLAERFVRDPAEVVKVGDRIEVRVLGVDLVRRRIALSARPAIGPERRGGGLA